MSDPTPDTDEHFAHELREERARAMDSLCQRARAGEPFAPLGAQASAICERLILKAWERCEVPASCALVAVGGFGRQALWPGSDVDLLLLRDQQPTPEQDAALERFGALLWDASLDPGISARTPAECLSLAQEDSTIASSLLERRGLAGSAELIRALDQEMQGLDCVSFLHAKLREQRARHERHGDSPYGLEPNLKEAPGGLRDLQTPIWMARAMGLPSSWDGLVSAGLLTGGEAELAQACEERLSMMRARLHWLAGRRDDRLTFENQSKLACELGIGQEQGKPASVVLMDGYFACARNVSMLNEVLIAGLMERLAPALPTRDLDERFHAVGHLLEAKDEALFAKEPHAILTTFEWMQRDPGLKGIGSRTTRALWRASRRVDAWFRADIRNREAFLRLLQAPSGVMTELRRMAKIGVLGAYIPAFGKAETLMQHDLFHAFTVGRHTLGVIRNLRRFALPEHSHEFPFLSKLADGFDSYWLLYLGALFHDIAKGRGGRHEEKGMEDARDFCASHSVNPEDSDLVCWLVSAHLEMSKISQKQDLQDPEVIQNFAKFCQTQRRLDALYLLTCADVRATGPTVWNAWKARLLEQLHQSASLALEKGGTPQAAARGKIAARKSAARQAACQAGASTEQAQALIASFDSGYWLRHDSEECSWHASLLWPEIGTRSSSVFARALPDEAIQVLARCPDKSALFARICAWFSRHGLSVVNAKLHTGADGLALDTFIAQDLRKSPDPDARAREIAESLALELQSDQAIEPPQLGRLSLRAQAVASQPQIALRDAGAGHWHLEVSSVDRSGLLWLIAKTLERNRAQVISAKVCTLGERAEDIFLLQGEALEGVQDRLNLERELAKALRLDERALVASASSAS